MPKDSLFGEEVEVDLSGWIREAMENRRDYKQAKNNVLIEKIDLKIKRNALWPEIDIEGTFAKNGIDSRYKDIFSQLSREDNIEVSIGFSITFPLGNRLAKAQYRKAELKKAQAILALKEIEKLIVTQMSNKQIGLEILLSQIHAGKEILSLQEKKLAAEEIRINLGRSSSDTLIRYQNDVLRARLGLLQRYMLYRVAEAELKVLKGVFLKDYIEVVYGN
jgi:outer membrane protein TolC